MELKNAKARRTNDARNMGDPNKIKVLFYTDPLCCWSWAMEPAWRRLRDEYRDAMRVTYKMAGLLPSWTNFSDPVNSIKRPSQMGPEWMHAKAVSGREIDSRIWIKDPPASSFPACIAVNAARLQSEDAGEKFLRLLWEAVMVGNLNIARTSVLIECAHNLSVLDPAFDLSAFREDLLGKRGKDAFTRDWQEVKYLGITRLPTLVFSRPGHGNRLLSGMQNYASLQKAVLGLLGE
jgi:predicted DsbA family dithiol-disulfide isomerase